MHTIAQLRSFDKAAADAGMTEDEIEHLCTLLANDPAAGDEISGTGGCRKLRLAGRGKGKRGGYRVVTFFTGNLLPVFLITVFAKGERSDLTQSERNALKEITKKIVLAYSTRVVRVGDAS